VAVPGRVGLEAAAHALPAAADDRQPPGALGAPWRARPRALAVLNGCLRLACGRKRRPSAGILDTQSVKTGPPRGPRGFDAGKQVKGRKRVLLVDIEGLVHAIQVVPASLQDRDTQAGIEPALAASSLLKIWADLAFTGDAAVAPMTRHGIDLELVGRRTRPGSWSSRNVGGSRRPSGYLDAIAGCRSIMKGAPACRAR
jgi:hypothetical protein